MPSENTIRADAWPGRIRATSNNFAQNGKCMVGRAFPFKRKERRSHLTTTNLAAKTAKT